jgi:hypothetical protein
LPKIKFEPSLWEISATILMLYPAFGPSKPVDLESNSEIRDSYIYSVLGKDGMHRYKLIFDTNRKDKVKQFFMDPLIRLLWPHISSKMAP